MEFPDTWYVERTKIRILVVDHNLLMREGLRILVMRQPDMDLVAVTASASEAFESVCERRPEVVLMDLDLPDSLGIKTIVKMSKLDPTLCIIGLFTFPWDNSARAALEAGARTCIAKDHVNQDLVKLIRECRRPDPTT